MKPGETCVSSGGDLPVSYVLHTACPKRGDEPDGSYPLLRECCRKLLFAAAGTANLHHLAMPLIGTGISGYSLAAPFYADTEYSLTAVTLLSAIMRFSRDNLHTVTIVCSSAEKYDMLLRTFRWMTGKGISKRNRIRGSLLGGAAGDALGYPVEFCDASDGSTREYIPDPETNTALISDDTQMTLFTACGVLWGYSRSCMRGIGSDLYHYIAVAYDDWLKTQIPDHVKLLPAISWIRNIPQLNALRAPGSTCLCALLEGGSSLKAPINDSKGCGGVMRIAPIALWSAANGHGDQVFNAQNCAEAAAITHGHPLGWLSAAALGNILYDILQNFSLEFAVRDTVLLLQAQYAGYPDTEIMVSLLQKAAALAALSGSTDAYNLMTELNITDHLGEGWTGEEALAVGLFCALAAGDDFDRCIRNGIWHRGDSDSTASIAGQIFGAYFGIEAIAPKWLRPLELRDVIMEIADDLTNDCRMSEYGAYHDDAWVRKYLSADHATHIASPGETPAHSFIQVPWPEKSRNYRTVSKYDTEHNVTGQYHVLIENGTISHAGKNKADVQTGSPGFGFVSLKFNEEKQLYTEHHGWVKLHPGNTVEGYYNNVPFRLIPDYAGRCIEVFSDTSPDPWVGTIRRRYDEWGNPLEFEFRRNCPGVSIHPLVILVSCSDYLRDFFLS